MASRVLLISLNRCAAPDPVFPLGLAHLNAALRQAGHATTWVDALANPERLAAALAEFRPEFVGISVRNIDDVLIRKQETFYEELPSLTARIHGQAHCPVILGGTGYSIFPQRLLDLAGADFGICGEGEASLVRLIASLEEGREPGGIPGLVFRRAGATAVNAPDPGGPILPLDAPDRPTAITSHYLQHGGLLNLQTQRGCAFRCCYCTYPVIEGRLHRCRPAEAVAEEFAQLERVGAKYAFIVDSVFNTSPGHVTAVCEAILRRGVRMSWGCFLRPRGLTAALVKIMARAGLTHIEFGSDSLCDEVLAAYQKDFTFEDVFRASEWARAANVDYCHFLIAGGPGETRETLRQGFANSQRLPGAVIMAVVGMRIYPGTPLFARAVAEGSLRRDADLLTPAYYLSPSLTAAAVFDLLEEFARLAPAWIVGDPGPTYAQLVARLRQRGVVGPLWSYFAMIQRLWPQGVSGVGTLEEVRSR
jgi:radical SAM superfamily enzyme YgiQ (UPF0313 family)